MLIDIIFAVLLLVAIFKGYSKGFVIAIFSFAALFIGLAAALKLSAYVGNRLKGSTHISSGWLPFLSFIIVFIIAVLLVSWCGKLIQKTFEMAMLGWLNRLAGIVLYVLMYTIIFSVFLFYAEKINLFAASTFQSSITWPYIKPVGPKIIDGFGRVLPVFKNMFNELESFFANLPPKISS
jgi:membrane protein required for colicin V production